MAFLNVNNVRVSGISACVPKTKLINDNADFVKTTGIKEHRIASKEICSSDLCQKAAEKLISDLNWNKNEIDALVFVSQTPDYKSVPATSCILQDKLGLSKNCYTLDISLGCSGWVYGMSVISSLMSSGCMKKGLLLAGDTPLKFCSPKDKSTYPLFGDAGTVTALEYKETSPLMCFSFNSNGGGYKDIVLSDGGYRNQETPESFKEETVSDGIVRNKLQLELDGMNVFSFGLSYAPKSVNSLIEHFELNKDNIDYFAFHQANRFMNEKIRKKLSLDESKVPYCIERFGNTSCASIPLTLVSCLRDELNKEKKTIIGCGFGVGLSWGSIYFETDKIIVPELLEI